ncbi:hypothetical protein MMC24_002555 [Lignoscripta atroalba]|nr:hypothetical protein [Lignoscripta atroalba]
MTLRSDTEGLQVAHPHSGLEAYIPYPENKFGRVPYEGTLPHVLHENPPQKRTCGVRRRTFWLIAALLIIAVLAAAIGGGIGGSLAHRKNQNSASSPIAQSSSSASPAPLVTGASSSTSTILPTSSLQPPQSTTTIVGPSTTLLRDCPSSNNTTYTVRLGAAVQEYRKACNTLFSTQKSNADNFVNMFTASLDDCIGQCAQWNVNSHESSSGLAQTCNAVCWRNNLDNDHPGSCFGYAVSESSDGSVANKPDINCDSALWVNVP